MVKNDRSLLYSLGIVLVFIISTAVIILIFTRRDQSTEYRSQAAYDDPCSSVCVGGIPAEVCTACKAANGLLPTPSPDPWDKCVMFPNDGTDGCIKTYKVLRRERDRDWRCKPATISYGLCPEVYIIEWPPGDPQ